MALDIARSSLYSGQINLWVEDALTRDYLDALWNEPAVKFLIGGGREGVQAILKDAEEAGYRNVYCVIDRDFGKSNHADWSTPGKTFRRFVLPRHEIENDLLEASALQASSYQNRGLDLQSIEDRRLGKSRDLLWWSACREVIAVLRGRFRESFVPDPTQSVADEKVAFDHICESDWFRKLATETGNSSRKDVLSLLKKSHAQANRRLENGEWRQDFAGKEILRDVAGWMCDRAKIPKFPTSDSEFYSDLAKQVARWQAANQKAPGDLVDLLHALKNRI